jgi:tetratricopeptide (TPR) repeat protein
VLASAPAPALLRRGLALGVGLALAVPTGLTVGPRQAHAVVLTAPDEDPALAESRAFYEEGKAKFDTFDYEGAVELWTKAYAKLPESEAGVRNAMVYNIATAQEKAYELDKDVQHLRQALLLLEQYVKTYKAMYQKTPETKAEVDKAEGRIAELKERIAKAERGEDTTPAPGPVAPTPTGPGMQSNDGIVWNSGHYPPADKDLMVRNRLLAQEEEKTDHMLIASYVTLSIGGVLLLGGAGAVYGGSRVRTDEDPDNGRGARGAGYGTLALGLASTATGITLMVIGFQRRKKARNGTLVAGTPVVAPGFAGASLRVRF